MRERLLPDRDAAVALGGAIGIVVLKGAIDYAESRGVSLGISGFSLNEAIKQFQGSSS